MSTLQEQLAAQGIALPPQDAPPSASPPQATPGVVNMPVQTITDGPAQLPLQQQIISARALPAGGGGGSNVDTSGMQDSRVNAGAPFGTPLDLGALRRPSDAASGPAINVDLSGMKGEQGTTYKAPAPLRAQVAGAGGPRVNPYANSEAEIARQRAENTTQLGLHQELGEQRFLQADARAAEADQFRIDAGERGKRHEAEQKAWEEKHAAEVEAFDKDKIDTGKWWADKSAIGKIGTVLQQVLGGFYMGWNHLAQNPADAQINAEIANNIDAQKANHAAKGEKLKGQQQVYSMMLERFKDENAASDATHAFYLDRVRAEGDRQASLTQNADAQDNWRKVDSGLALESARMKDSAQQALIRGSATGAVKGNLVVPTGDGKGVIFKTEEEAKKAREKRGLRDALLSDMTQLRDLEKGATAADKLNPLSEYHQKKEALLADANVKKNVAEGQGAMSKDDKTNTEAGLGALSGVSNLVGNGAKRVDEAIGRIRQGGDAELRAQGGQIVQEAQGANGQQAWVPTGQTYEAKSLREQVANQGAPAPTFKQAQ
jgi:hypothetical protein